MPANLSDISKKRARLETDIKACEDAVKKLDTMLGKFVMEWKTIYNGLIEGKKDIEEMEKQLPASKNTWKQMLGRLQPIKGKVEAVGPQAESMQKTLEKIQAEAKKVAAEVPKAGGDLKDLKSEADALKSIDRVCERLWTDFNRIKQDANGLAPDPKL